jgi:hypothetical protein
VYLDLAGAVPTSREARDFLARTNATRRADLIDHLLAGDSHVRYFTMKWCDVLRVKSEFPINLWPNAVQAYGRWIYAAVRDHWPYDRFARELLTASGSNFRDPAVNFFRAVQKKEPQAIAQAVALTFLGERAERWPPDRLAGLAGFFAQVGYKSTTEWKEEIIFHDPDLVATNPATGQPFRAIYPDGRKATLTPPQDPRAAFADWLIQPGNPSFARAQVNRLWYWVMGRGLIHEPDDLRPDNPPENPELLAWLEKEFIAHGYDNRHVLRLILTSDTYQRSSIPADPAAPDDDHFSHYRLRRLEAEVLLDEIDQIAGTTDSYSSPIPEPFTYLPDDTPAVAVADGSISSPFLEMFGRPPRDTGQALERNDAPSAAQKLHLLNSTHIQKKLRNPAAWPQVAARKRDTPQAQVDELYLAILSRHPTAAEQQLVLGARGARGTLTQFHLSDLAWALVNSHEFIYRH